MEAARPHRPRRGPARPLSVAELVSLHSGPPGTPERVAEIGPPLSVGALLRREGRAPHAFDRPTVPRGHSRPPEEPPAPVRGRKASAASGAVLLVGAVLGTAVVNEAVVAQPHATPGTDGGPTASGAEAAAVAGSGRAVGAPDRPVAVSYFAPLTTVTPPTSTPTGSAPTGFDLPVASGASIGRGALGGSPVAVVPSAPAPGAADSPPVAIPLPRSPAGEPPTAAPPAAAQPAAQQPAPPATVTPPTVQTPVVDIPAVPLTPVLGPAHTPAVTVSPAEVTPPTVSVSASGGVATGPAQVTSEVGAGAVQAGPAGLSKTDVGLPDVTVSKASVGKDVTLPGVAVSKTTLTTPDLKLGKAEVPLPDVTLPAVEVPSVSLPVAAPVKAVTGVVGGLLGQS